MINNCSTLKIRILFPGHWFWFVFAFFLNTYLESVKIKINIVIINF